MPDQQPPAPPPPDQVAAANRQMWSDRMSNARQHGASWDEIHTDLSQRMANAKAHGATDAEIQHELGFSSPDEMVASMQSDTAQHIQATQPTSMVDAFISGLTHSSGAALLGVEPGEDLHQGSSHGSAVANAVGETIGDLPTSILGGLGGSLLGAGGGAAAGGGPEDVPSDIAGGYVGAAAGATALPQLIKSERDRFVRALNSGQIHSPEDFLRIQGDVTVDTAKAGLVGVATAGAGRVVAPVLRRMGAGKLATLAGTVATEAGTMTVAQAALAGHMPKMEDFIDSAITLGAFHAGTHMGPAALRAVRTRLQQNYVNTGQLPTDAVDQARHDPAFRQRMLGQPDPPVPAGSSRTAATPPLPHQPGQLPGPHTPLPGDQLVVPRAVGDFDHAVPWILQHEGGMTTDQGGLTNFGISHNANPDIDIAHLTREGAIELYHQRYWTAIDADHLPDEMKLAAFDSAVNQGVGQTRAWLREAGGDLQAFMRLRAQKYAQLARTGKYSEAQVRSWGNRMRDLGAGDGMAGVVERGSAHVGEAFTPEEMAHLDHEGAPAETEGMVPRPEPITDRGNEGNPTEILGIGRREPTATPAPTAPPVKGVVSADPIASVLSRQGEIQDPSFFDRLRGGLKDTYLEMFNNKHPIHQLVNAWRKGAPLDDARNPEFLHRLAELSDTPSEYAIEAGMLGLDGSKTKIRGLRSLIMQGKGKAGRQDYRDLLAYGISKWAIEKAAQGKETGVHLPDAEAVVAHFESGGKVVPGEDLDAQAARIGTKVTYYPPGHPMVRSIGPHYNRTRNSVELPDLTDAEYHTRYGPNLGREEVKAHEMGHAVAFSMGDRIGKGDWSHLSPEDLRDLHDELNIASRRFKPEFWEKTSPNRPHAEKPVELMADAFATWMTDPQARTKMPDFQRILEREMGPKFNMERELGAVPKEWGTNIQQRFSEIQDWSNQTLKWLRDGGIISSASYRSWVAFNEARIPGYRIQDNEKPSVGAAGSNVFNPVREFEGSKAQIEPVYENLQKEAYLRMQLAKSNAANLATADLAHDMGLASKRPVNTATIDILSNLAAHGIDDDVLGMVARELVTGGALKRNEVPIFRDGKLEAWTFEDPDITKMMRGYDRVAIPKILAPARMATNLMRQGIVLNPLFPLKIATYDLQFQTIINPDARNAVLGFMQGMGHVLGNSPIYDEWMRSGGAEKVFDSMHRDAAIQARLKEISDPKGGALGVMASGVWNAARTPVDLLATWGRTISQFQRVGRFAQGKDRGESMTAAAVASTEAAFHRPGFGGPVSRFLTQIIPFFTAHLNGLEKTTRALLGGALPENRTVMGTQYNASSAWMKGAALITAPMLLQWAANKDQEWYKAIPAWQRGLGLWFHFGGDSASGHGVTIAIPYPPLISLIFGEIPRRMAEQFFNDNPHAWDDFGKSAILSMLPPGTITGMSILQPGIEGMSNHSFLRDSPLVSDDTRTKTGAAEQYTEYSTGAAKALARFADDMPLTHLNMGWSPPIIDNYIREWGGPLGETAVRTADALLRSGDHNQAPAMSVSDWPLIGSWTSRYPGANSAPMEQFYRASDHLSQVHNSINAAIRSGDWARFRELVDNSSPTAVAYQQFRLENDAPPNVDTSRYADYLGQRADQADGQALDLIKQAEQAMKAARQYTHQVYENPDLTANDKRQMLDATYATMQMMSERANQVFDHALIGTSRQGRVGSQPLPDQITFEPPGQ